MVYWIHITVIQESLMLTSVDRVQVVVSDRAAAVQNWERLLGAKQVGEDESKELNAKRTTIQAGRSLFEFLEPAGDGPVEAWASQWHEGLFGAVFATADLDAMARHFSSTGVENHEDAGALVLDPHATHGMQASVVQQQDRDEVGLISHLYEVTNVVNDWQDTAAVYTRLFELDPTAFVPVSSEASGYAGTLTLFQKGRLDRIEIVQASGEGDMASFFQRRGPSLYMCFVEAPDIAALVASLDAAGVRYTSHTWSGGGGLLVEPDAFNGMRLGVSQTDVAWSWSGGKPA
jgi:hypothetical protein